MNVQLVQNYCRSSTFVIEIDGRNAQHAVALSNSIDPSTGGELFNTKVWPLATIGEKTAIPAPFCPMVLDDVKSYLFA